MVQIQRPQRITLMYLHLPISRLKNCEVKWGLLILRNTVLPSNLISMVENDLVEALRTYRKLEEI